MVSLSKKNTPNFKKLSQITILKYRLTKLLFYHYEITLPLNYYLHDSSKKMVYTYYKVKILRISV